MIKNILVGYNGERGGQVAFRLAADVARAAQARLHLAYAEPGAGPQPQPLLPQDLRADAMGAPLPDVSPNFPEDPSEAPDVFADIAEQCRAEGLHCTFQHTYGDPADRLSQLGRTAGLLAIGRHDEMPSIDATPLGRVARQIVTRLPTAVLLGAREYQEVKAMTVVYEPSSLGGRTLALAGEIAHLRNLTLNVAALGRANIEPQAALIEARFALRAYHVEGEFLALPTAGAEGHQAAALTWNDSLVVLSAPPRGWLSRPLDSIRPVLALHNVSLLLVP